MMGMITIFPRITAAVLLDDSNCFVSQLDLNVFDRLMPRIIMLMGTAASPI